MEKPSRNQKFEAFSIATRIRVDQKPQMPKLSTEDKRRLIKGQERAHYLKHAQMMNGPDSYVDKKIREFAHEYNRRVFKGYGSEQPMSFQILQDFVEPDDDTLILKILPEKHYSLDTNFVLDVLTAPNRNSRATDLFDLTEGHIYFISVPGGYEDFKFPGVNNLAFFGCAFVRHEDELSIFMLGAKDNPERDLELVEANDIHPQKPFLKPDSGFFDHNHAEFYNHPSLYPVVFLSRIDLKRGSTLVRYVLSELRDGFNVACDDRAMYAEMVFGPMKKNTDVVLQVFNQSSEVLSKHAEVFALMSELPHVLLGIEDNDDLKTVRVPTEINLNKQKTPVRKMKKVLSPSEAPYFINVGTIVQEIQHEAETSFDVVEFKVEQSGYWKQLAPEKYGYAKNGDKIFGKAWVNVQESWEESFGFSPPESTKTVTVKTGPSSSDVGEIYVMRNAQHPHDTYKIGYTTKTSDERASQLQSTTGQPDQFAIMNSWKVFYPRRVEGIIHERLKKYRINPKREFFRVKYKIIQKTINEVIRELGAEIEES